MRKYVRWLLPVLLLLWCVFIFHFSLADAEESGATSGRFVTFFNTVLADMGSPFRFSSAFVRKAAHFTEFFVLGLIAFANAAAFLRAYRLPAAVGFAALTAVADECLQFLSPGRAPGVLDVLLDTAGALFGAALLRLILFLIAKKKKSDDRSGEET